ncbi:MAG: polysaccharide deacetylase family protein [Ignavibacteriae bacterium]|nr:polysaccharide deacetylase family protein [Ignavibacteriota bacterium]
MKESYEKLYSLLPQRAKVMASELVFKLSGKPYVYHDKILHPPNGLGRGVVSFSIDFELAWAWQYARNQSKDCEKIALHEREQVPRLLAKFDEYGIGATWATVGHLFLEKCERGWDGLAHSDMRRLQHFENEYWKFSSGDWFQHDPCSSVDRDPAWYAPDLIEQILASKAGHEIGCHSFSHSAFGVPCSSDVAASEIDACLEAMKPFGLRPTTWVFPGNIEGNFDTLATRGFKGVRAFPHSWAEVSLPLKRNDDMWGIHASTPIDLDGGGWNLEERLARLKKYVDRASATNLSTHIWFHPSLPRRQIDSLLFPLLRYCAELREKGAIDILTLDGLVDATEDALIREGKV